MVLIPRRCMAEQSTYIHESWHILCFCLGIKFDKFQSRFSHVPTSGTWLWGGEIEPMNEEMNAVETISGKMHFFGLTSAHSIESFRKNERVTYSLSVMVAPQHGLVENQLSSIWNRPCSKWLQESIQYSHTGVHCSENPRSRITQCGREETYFSIAANLGAACVFLVVEQTTNE